MQAIKVYRYLYRNHVDLRKIISWIYTSLQINFIGNQGDFFYFKKKVEGIQLCTSSSKYEWNLHRILERCRQIIFWKEVSSIVFFVSKKTSPDSFLAIKEANYFLYHLPVNKKILCMPSVSLFTHQQLLTFQPLI